MRIDELEDRVAQIIEYGARLYQKGLVAGFDGNLSFRNEDGTILVTASGVHKGMLTKEHVLLTDARGEILEGRLRPSTEVLMHVKIYENTGARAIIHAHPPFTIAASISMSKLNLDATLEGRLLLGQVQMIPELAPGSSELADAAGKASSHSKLFVLKAHGAVSIGQNFQEAFGMLEALEHNLRIMAYSRLFAGDKVS